MEDLLKYLPTSRKEMTLRGWDYVDVIIFSGDAYVDHPQFGAAVIGRVIEREGKRVAIVPQPDWHGDYRDFLKLGEPRLFFAVTAGAMDSMVNHYTANKRRRLNDAYTPDGRPYQRPDNCTVVYCRILRQFFPNTPIIIGGVEASMRRLSHYDYWTDTVQPSILVQSQADILVYGMAEKAITQLLYQGIRKDIPQTTWLYKNYRPSIQQTSIELLHSFEEVQKDKRKFNDNFNKIDSVSHQMHPPTLVEPIGQDAIVVNPPFEPMTTPELDDIYSLPFTYRPHPKYRGKRIPAYEMIQFSICLHRGCFGGCSFCAIASHQGKFITSRSKKSILNQINIIANLPEWKGYISDLGGPSANMYSMTGRDISKCKQCHRNSCIMPNKCPNLSTNVDALMDIYHSVDAMTAVKKSFVSSGVRYDIAEEKYLEDLIVKHVSGRLKVAPEHTEMEVLRLMNKPSFDKYIDFEQIFKTINTRYHLKQQVVPYFISSHPGCTMQHMKNLGRWLQSNHLKVEQVQDFTPTPMTLSTAMFHTGYHPHTKEKIFVAKELSEKKKQNDAFFWWKGR